LTRLIRIAVMTGLVAACCVLFAMMALIVAEVVLRNAFGSSLLIVDEYSGYMVVAIFSLGVAYSLQEQALLRVEFLLRLLREDRQRLAMMVFDLLALAFSLSVTYQLARFTVGNWRQGVFAPTTAMTPLYVPQLVMPVGMALVCIVLIANIVAGIRAVTHRGKQRP
jgi:TRAP-type C4-dicarboxylate transport system permease small subunit